MRENMDAWCDQQDFVSDGDQILILEMLLCIPVVKIFAFLDLAQIFSFMDGH